MDRSGFMMRWRMSRRSLGALALGVAGFVFVGAHGAMAAPIVINSVAELQSIQNNLSGDYVLGGDIDASGTANSNGGLGFQPIGSNPFQGGAAFTGTFDGLGHTINGLTINRPSTDIVGLFGYVIGYSGGGDVRNVRLTNVSIVGHSGVGGLVGYSDTGHISTVSVTGSVRGTDGIGGLIGWGGSYYGYSLLTTSWATSSVTGTSSVGGLVGGGVAIENSYATGTVTGTSYVGGLAGDTGAPVSSSYAAGAVQGSNNVGGLIGGSGATVTNSYWDTQTSGQPTSVGGTGLTTAQLQSGVLPSGFDPAIWSVVPGRYPMLRANASGGPALCSISGVPLFSQSCPASIPICNIPKTCTNKDPINCLSDGSCADSCSSNGDCAGGTCSRWSGDPFKGGGTIGLYGCYTSSIAMLINYESVAQSRSFSTTPRLLNNFLGGPCSPDQGCRGCGYDANGGMNEWTAACYARHQGVALYYNGTLSRRDDTALHNYLCGSGLTSTISQPVILGLGGHFVLATGEAGAGTWSVNDPAGGIVHNQTNYKSIRRFSKIQETVGATVANSLSQSVLGDEVPPDTRGFLRIVIDQCVPFLVTDPEGRRSGIDPATGDKLDEIPAASYLDNEFLSDPENPGLATSSSCVFEVIGPLDGAYKVEFGGSNETAYTASFFQANRSEGTSRIVDVAQFSSGTPPPYLVEYSGEPGAAIKAQRVNRSSVPALSKYSTAMLIALLGLVAITSLKVRSNHPR